MHEILTSNPVDVINKVIQLLVDRNYSEIIARNKNHDKWFDDFEKDVVEIGLTLTYPPNFPDQANDITTLEDGSGWSVDLPVFSEEEGMTDFTLQMFVNKELEGVLSFEIFSLRVM